MKVPPAVNILALAVGATAFYTWVGQLVPQTEVLAPVVVEMAADMTTDEMVDIGRDIFEGKGLCSTCHTLGKSGALRFPDLAGIAIRAGDRVPGVDPLAYLAESLYEPNAFIVPGFNPGMPEIDKPPVALSDDEIKAVIAYLQTLGGEATITMATRLPYEEGAEATDVDPPGGATGAQEAAAAQTAAVTSPGSIGEGGAALLARFGCTDCHTTEAGGEKSLAGVGGRLDRPAIQRWLVDHQPPLPVAYRQQVTLADVEAMTEFLAGLKGAG
jgi:mono/diheme cytochrome c family protein